MHLPAWLQSLRHKVARLRARAAERTRIRYDDQGVRIPPPDLIYLVSGRNDVGWFISSGKLGARSLRDILGKNWVDIVTLESILDFGCGVGRVLRHLPALTGARLFGCDYNGKLIAWCRGNLPFAAFSISGAEERLEYDDCSFELIYALSVFTHFTQAQHRFWIGELRRVLRPGGYLFLTTHGKHYEDQIPEHLRKSYHDGELVVMEPDRAGQNICAAFHPEKYVRNELARGWELIDFVEQGAAGNPLQDVYLLRKPRD
jgi:SAM-dependent methyltransferase